MIRRTPVFVFVLVLVLMSVCNFGCDEESVRRYRTPKQIRSVAVAKAPAPTPTQKLTWTLPQGWREFSAQGMGRVVTFETGDGEDRAEVAVTVFSGDVGGVKANVNRWRKQVGLEPVDSVDDQPIQVMQVNQHPAKLIELPGLLVVMIDDHGRTWFVKMRSSPEAIAHHREAFVSFVQSLKWNE